MFFSVSSYSYKKPLVDGSMNEHDVFRESKQLGFDAVELVDSINFDIPKTQYEEKAKELRKAAESSGLTVSCLTVGADFLTGSNGNTEREIERIKKFVDLGAILGVDHMRHDATKGYPKNSPEYVSFETVLPRLVSACREITEYAAKRGIVTMVENHGQFAQDSERVEKLCCMVDHPNFRLLGDMGNFLCADENPATAFARIAPYLGYIHAKDFIIKPFDACDPGEGTFRSRSGNYLRGTIVGHGNVPIKQCLYLAKVAGFDGCIALEFEGLEPTRNALRIGLANIKRYWGEVQRSA